MDNRSRIVLNKILREIEEIEQFTEGHSFDTFNENNLLKKAVAMSIINIGELVKALDQNFRSKYQSIPWRSIAGMRDIIAHKYETLRSKDVWKVVTDSIPALKSSIQEVIK
jgi:uncharacterized protein with HEPN domain